MASNRAQILISAVDQTKTAFDSIKRGLGGLTDTAKSINGVLANLGVLAVSVAMLVAWRGPRPLAIGLFAVILVACVATLLHHATDRLTLSF